MKPYPLQVEISGPIALCYRLHADVDWNRRPKGELAESPDGQCAPHALSLAYWMGESGQKPGEGRRWHKSRTNSTSAVPDYADSESGFRDGTVPCATENHVIPAFLEMVFDQPRVNATESMNN